MLHGAISTDKLVLHGAISPDKQVLYGADYEGVGITAAVGDRQWQGADITQ